MMTLKRISTLIIVLTLCAACSHSQNEPLEKGLLWEISGNGLERSSFLFGTWHGTYDILSEYLDSIPGFYKAFDSCDQYVGEVADLNELGNYASKMDFKLPADTTWEDLLDPTDYKFLDSVLMKRMRAPLSEIHIKPTLLSLILTKIEEIEKLTRSLYTKPQIDSMAERVIDMVLTAKAKKRGYTLLGLETIEEQLKLLLTSDDMKKDARFLIRYLRDTTISKMNDDLTAELQTIYRSHDLNELASLELRVKVKIDSLFIDDPEIKADYEKSMSKLVDARNIDWVAKIPGIIREKRTFIGVGVRHLPGEKGLIRLLRKKGYLVEAVR